jgi:TRAP-type mannitol/chloroaromatic compound transport system permease small subunit
MTPGSARSGAAWLKALDRFVDWVTRAAGVLALPLSLLLFLQWPLREVVQAYSREANDLAQCLFALYVSVAIAYATRRGTHLATDVVAHRYSPGTRARLARVASLVVLVPGSIFVLVAAWPIVVQSVVQLEAFPETFNPGYFIVKLAVALLALLVLLQALIDGFRTPGAARE